MLGALKTHRYIEDRYIGVLSHTFYCNFCRDITYLSLYRGYRYIEDRCIGVPLYFIHELKYSKRSGQVIDDIMSLFWLLNKFLGRTLLSCKFHCFVMKLRLSIALGLVSRHFSLLFIPPFMCRRSKDKDNF